MPKEKPPLINESVTVNSHVAEMRKHYPGANEKDLYVSIIDGLLSRVKELEAEVENSVAATLVV